jgi:hypothetical protein
MPLKNWPKSWMSTKSHMCACIYVCMCVCVCMQMYVACGCVSVFCDQCIAVFSIRTYKERWQTKQSYSGKLKFIPSQAQNAGTVLKMSSLARYARTFNPH